jgi:hypothetical protein
VERQVVAKRRPELALRADIDGDRQQARHVVEISPAPQFAHRLADQGDAPADLLDGALVGGVPRHEAPEPEARSARR